MMKTVLAATVLLAGAALVAPAQAQQSERYAPISGEKLAQLCTSRTMGEACLAYLNGISDTITDYQASRPENGSKGQPLEAYICVPGRLTGPQLRDAYLAWARQNQGELQRQASVVVIRALLATFPCQRQ